MQYILCKIYFLNVYHMHGKLICNLYALLCWQNFILVKSGCYNSKLSNHFSYVICTFTYCMVESDIVVLYIRSGV
jgi:hypothetical protein